MPGGGPAQPCWWPPNVSPLGLCSGRLGHRKYWGSLPGLGCGPLGHPGCSHWNRRPVGAGLGAPCPQGGWHAAMGVDVSHRSSVLGAVQPGGKVTASGASEPTTRPAWTRCVMRWGNTGWMPRTTEVAFLAVLGAGDQSVCHGWAGTDPMGAFEVAQPCWGVF